MCFQLIPSATKSSALMGFLDVMMFRPIRKRGKNKAAGEDGISQVSRASWEVSAQDVGQVSSTLALLLFWAGSCFIVGGLA